MGSMTTKIRMAVGTAHDDALDGFEPCHPGCTTWQHGHEGCAVWTREELFRRCEAEVANMPADRRSQMIARMHAFRGSYTLKTPARFGYINRVEWIWETHEEFDRWMTGIAKTGAEKGWSEIEIAHETANAWNRFRQDDAMDVLFAYGLFSRDEIKAARARWDFTKPMPGSDIL